MTALHRALTVGATAAALVLALSLTSTSHAQTTPVPAQNKPTTGIYPLDQFGPIDTPQATQATFDKAAKAISAAGGGIIIVPRQTAPDWHSHTAPQPMLRVPDPPAPAAKWGTHPGVSVYDLRTPDVFYTAQTSGIKITRDFMLPMGQTLPPNIDAPIASIHQDILRGTSSYGERSLSDATAGTDKTLTLPTINGLFPGLVLAFGPKDARGTFTVKYTDFDKTSKSWTATGDLSKPVAKGDLLEHVTLTGALNLQTLSHNENQTFDLMIWHETYAAASRNLVKTSFKYQGDNIPSPGGRGTVLMGAYTQELLHPFEGQVESFDAQTGALVYKKEATATDTIGSGRPIINMNPAKQIRSKANVYPNWGPIELTENVPVDGSMHGWFVAIDDPAEHIPGTNALRWYPISYVNKTPDGKPSLGVLRYWWGAHAGRGIGELFTNLWSSKEAVKEINVIIAPGALVYDASEAVQRPEHHMVHPQRMMKLVPSPFAGSPADFAPGDPITQAIGPDPWHPAIFRSWIWDSLPSIGHNPILDIQNIGPIPRGSVMHVHGSSTYNTYMQFQGGGPVGIRFQQDVPGGALVMNAPPENSKSPLSNGILFTYPGEDKKPTVTGLGISPSGRLQFWGRESKGTSLANQSLSGATGINSESGNLRGLALPVTEGKTSHQVKFNTPETTDEYALIIRPTWITNYAVQAKNPQGFTVIFDKPAPKDAAIDWLLVR